MRVVPVGTGVGKLDPRGKRLPGLNRPLGFVCAVKAVVQAQAVPVDGVGEVTLVLDPDLDLGALGTLSVGPGIEPL